MDTNTILIIVLVIVLLGAGGWSGRGRWSWIVTALWNLYSAEVFLFGLLLNFDFAPWQGQMAPDPFHCRNRDRLWIYDCLLGVRSYPNGMPGRELG